MPALPDPGQMDQIEAACLAAYDAGQPRSVVELAELLMDLPDLPMHCPYHHFLVPTAMLTAACLSAGEGRDKLEGLLKQARERAGTVPGGYCGQFGACGAAIGAGIFASLWQKTTPLSKTGWAAANEMTARALSAIASVEGPRCCKRVTYLTLHAACPAARELLGVDIGPGPEELKCHHFTRSRECRKTACPFFPAKASVSLVPNG